MTIFCLEVKASLDNVSTISPTPDNEWKLTIKNPLNDYERKEGVTVQESEMVEMENAHVKDVHLAVKWEGANKFSTLTILPKDAKELKGKKKSPDHFPGDLTEADTWTCVLAVDCRGMEPTGYLPGDDEFTVKSEGGSLFSEEVDFSDEYCEYCEKSELPVGVSDFQYRWIAI